MVSSDHLGLKWDVENLLVNYTSDSDFFFVLSN